MDDNSIFIVTQKNADGTWSWAAAQRQLVVGPPQGKFKTQDDATAAAALVLKLPKGT